MKKIMMIITLVLVVSICSCASAHTPSPTEYEPQFKSFVIVAEGSLETKLKAQSEVYQIIMYDPDTLIMYTLLNGPEECDFTELYNPDGTRKLFSHGAKYELFTIIGAKKVSDNVSIFQSILYDPDNMVMYTYFDGYHSAAIKALHNSDGTMKLFKNE